jgi:transposase
MPVREYSRDFVWLMPPSLDELIPRDHQVRFVAAFVDQLDLSAIGINWVPAKEGNPGYNRRMLLACWLYGFMTRVRSSRKIEAACVENVPFMWLTGIQRPDHCTLSRFYKANRKCMRKLLKRTVDLAIEMGLVDFAVQAIDGTKIGCVTLEGRLGRKKIEELRVKVDEEIAAMERGIEEEESGNQPQAKAKLPKELKRKKELRDRIQNALAKLDDLEKDGKKQVEAQEENKDKQSKKPKVSVVDPEAVMMKGRHGYALGYNGQVGVDGKARIIVGADVANEASDTEQLLPMLREIEETTGRLGEKTVSDGGYHSADNLKKVGEQPTEVFMVDPQMSRKEKAPDKWRYHKDSFVYDEATDSFVCPEGKTLGFLREKRRARKPGQVVRVYRGQECSGCPAWGEVGCSKDKKGRTLEITGQEELVRQHRQKMQTEEARGLMKRRAGIVELVFGVMREQMGFVRFLLRGLENVRAEWRLACTAYNLRRIWKECWINRTNTKEIACERVG